MGAIQGCHTNTGEQASSSPRFCWNKLALAVCVAWNNRDSEMSVMFSLYAEGQNFPALLGL